MNDDDTKKPTTNNAGVDEFSDFSEFYRRFVPVLIALLVWQGARLHEAADIAQETMIRAYQHWSEINNPSAWSCTVASRKLARHIASIDEYPVARLSAHGSLLPHSLDVETWERRHEILRVLEHLSPRQRQVLAWTMYGYGPAEIASELQITFQTVRTNLSEAHSALDAYLSTTGNER
jgi:RNA polymerase sigma factor (sigma-70 family)